MDPADATDRNDHICNCHKCLRKWGRPKECNQRLYKQHAIYRVGPAAFLAGPSTSSSSAGPGPGTHAASSSQAQAPMYPQIAPPSPRTPPAKRGRFATPVPPLSEPRASSSGAGAHSVRVASSTDSPSHGARLSPVPGPDQPVQQDALPPPLAAEHPREHVIEDERMPPEAVDVVAPREQEYRAQEHEQERRAQEHEQERRVQEHAEMDEDERRRQADVDCAREEEEELARQAGGGNVVVEPAQNDDIDLQLPVDEPDPNPEDGLTEETGAPRSARLKELRIAQQFIARLRRASHEQSGMSTEAIERLRNPQQRPLTVNRYQRAGVRMYLARGDASEANYADHRAATIELHPEDADFLPTYEQTKRLITELTGIGALVHDMCIHSCMAYVGPYEELTRCPFCTESRYDHIYLARGRKVARRTFHTYPLGPQLQAMWASPENARLMQHRSEVTQRILGMDGNFDVLEDMYFGQDYINAARAGKITPNDSVVMLSLDGAQLYENKQSDCWFYLASLCLTCVAVALCAATCAFDAAVCRLHATPSLV